MTSLKFLVAFLYLAIQLPMHSEAREVSLDPRCERVDLLVVNNSWGSKPLAEWNPREITTNDTYLDINVVNECTGKTKLLDRFGETTTGKMKEFTKAFSVLTGVNRVLMQRSAERDAQPIVLTDLIQFPLKDFERTIQVSDEWSEKKVISYYIYLTSAQHHFFRTLDGAERFHLVFIKRSINGKSFSVPIGFVAEELQNHEKIVTKLDELLAKPKIDITRDPMQFFSTPDLITFR